MTLMTLYSGSLRTYDRCDDKVGRRGGSVEQSRRAVRRLQAERHAGHDGAQGDESRAKLELADAAFLAPNSHPTGDHQVKYEDPHEDGTPLR